MANTIITKNSATATAVPTSGELVQGELAVNVTDKRIFTENSGGTVVELGVNPSSLTLASGTANGVAYLNGSKVLTSGSALTFNGSTLVAPSGGFQLGTTAFISGGGATNLIAGTNAAVAFEFRTNASTRYQINSDGTSIWSVSNLERMRLTSTGLGIGTDTPAASMVAGTASTAIVTIGGGDGSLVTGDRAGTLSFKSDDSSYKGTFADGIVAEICAITSSATGAAYDLSFHTGSTAGRDERLRITSTGLVGIGTTSPDYKLNVSDVNRTGNSSNQVIFTTTTQAANIGGTLGLGGLFNGSSSTMFGVIRGGKENGTSGNYAGYLGFETVANGNSITERMRLDSAGNLGLGVTPAAWGNTWTAQQIGLGGSLVGRSAKTNELYLGANWYYNGTSYIYIGSDYATQYYQYNGAHVWRTAPSGTAGEAISFTQAMTLTAAGNLGIGETLPDSKLEVAGPDETQIKVTGASGVEAVLRASASTVTVGSNTNHNLYLRTNNSARMTIEAGGNVGIGTISPTGKLSIAVGTYDSTTPLAQADDIVISGSQSLGMSFITTAAGSSNQSIVFGDSDDTDIGSIKYAHADNSMQFTTNASEAMRLDSSGNLLVGKTSTDASTVGLIVNPTTIGGYAFITNIDAAGSNYAFGVNRQNSDGSLIVLRQANVQEGYISVSGTTVSYNGGHLSRAAQTVAAKDESLKKGTVLSNLDEMNSYTDADGNLVDNEQLNKVKVSDVEGDANVAGVFVNWAHDDAHDVDEINMAMTGDMIIRIAQGVTVVRGDLLMSAGNGTAKPQGDDIVRSKTIAKVTSTHVTCTYEDGSFCVPCVLMAC